MGTTQANNLQQATWRGATPYHADTDRMGLLFDLPDGQVVRLAISRESAARLAGAIADYLPEAGSGELLTPSDDSMKFDEAEWRRRLLFADAGGVQACSPRG